MNAEELINKNKILEEENKELKEKLKKYTAPARHKIYYENHKEEVLARNKAYQVTKLVQLRFILIFRLSPVPIQKKNRKK